MTMLASKRYLRIGAALGIFLTLGFVLVRVRPAAADDSASTSDATANDAMASDTGSLPTSTSVIAPPATDTTTTDSDDAQSLSVPTTTPDMGTETDSTDAPDATTALDATTTPDVTAALDSPATSTVIVTGDAGAVANITNVVNTNVVDSQGFLSLLNLFQPYIGNIDLSNLDFQSSVCSACTVSNLSVSNTNSSTIVNNVNVTANTGDNTIDSSGDAAIETGDAGAAANVVNVANTNIINSNYLLFVLNNFSTMQGDLVLPGESFFDDFLGNGDGSSSTGGDTTIANMNSSTIENAVGTTADTGGNSTADTGTSTVATGDSAAVSNVVNVANTNITSDNQVFLLVRVLGTWNGSVFSVPPGLSWTETPDGILLTGSGVQNICGSCGGTTDIQNSNTATVQNNVQVYALTGDNEIAGNGNGSAAITTGDAAAASNVVNVVNTNIVGHNILLGIVNVFGDWEGNLAFGQPDLWVGVQADVSDNPLVAGSSITYHITLTNHGTADATDVQLQTADSDPGLVNGGGVSWNIPDVTAGATMQFTYTENVADDLPFGGQSQFTETVSATEHEDDANQGDNSDSISFLVNGPGTGSVGTQRISHLVLSEMNNAPGTIAPGTQVTYKLYVSDADAAGPASDVRVHETLYDPYGTILATSTWAIGDINPGNKFLIKYDADFPSSTKSGWYTSYASVDGVDSSGVVWKTADSVTSSSIYLVNPADFPAPPPPPLIVYVPPPPEPTSTPLESHVGSDHNNVEVNQVESLLLPAAPPIAPPPSATNADLTASIASLFSNWRLPEFQTFFSNTGSVFAAPFFRLW